MEPVSSTGRAGSGVAAVRLLAVITVVLGLLGMHGLASSHHATAAAPAHSSAVTAEPLARQHQAPSSQHGTATAAAAWTVAFLLGDTTTGPVVPVCDDDCPNGLALLCAAVLTAALATVWLVVAMATRRSPAAPARPGVRARAPARARLLPRAPDPVAELCISRT